MCKNRQNSKIYLINKNIDIILIVDIIAASVFLSNLEILLPER